jgi:hypothetical protein
VTIPEVSRNPRTPPIPLDPRRWFTLAIVIIAVLIVALDTTVLNVAIPTILRDLHTTLPSLQWVITGYSLTFASLLIIGGRLGVTPRIDADYGWPIGWRGTGTDNLDVLCNGAEEYASSDSFLPVDGWRLKVCPWWNNQASSCIVVAQISV